MAGRHGRTFLNGCPKTVIYSTCSNRMEVNMTAGLSKLLLAIPVATAGLTFSCSSSAGPQPGTPAYFWSAAKETFAASDYVKTSDNLDKILASDNEYTARALPWRLILASGMARGYMDVADNLEMGVRAKKADPGGFRKYISNSRSAAGRLSLQFAEMFMRYQKGKDDPVALAFSYPSGSAAPIAELTKASAGMPLQGAEIEGTQKRAVERAVLMETCRAAGAPGRHRQNARDVQERKRAGFPGHVSDGHDRFALPTGAALRPEKNGRSGKIEGLFQSGFELAERCSGDQGDQRAGGENPERDEEVAPLHRRITSN